MDRINNTAVQSEHLASASHGHTGNQGRHQASQCAMGSCQQKHLICAIHLTRVSLLVATYSQIIQCPQVSQDPHIQLYNPRGDSRSSFSREALGPPTTAYPYVGGSFSDTCTARREQRQRPPILLSYLPKRVFPASGGKTILRKPL